MAITENQIEITKEYRKELFDELREFLELPADVKKPFAELWDDFKRSAQFDDDNQADLAAFGALEQFAKILGEFEPEEAMRLLRFFKSSVLLEVNKGNRP